jgi:predicted ATPase
MDPAQETLEYQVNYWLSNIVNTSVSTEDNIGPEFLNAYYTPSGSRQTRPGDVGSGIGYIVSVIIMCLASKPGDIIIIENPEIHLHPSAQSKVCRFIYFIASAGRQLFVETHSDHIFNGIRKGIATGQMKPENINVSFFSLDEKRCTKNTKIEFGKRGRILNTVDGLFDQFDIDLNAMIGV